MTEREEGYYWVKVEGEKDHHPLKWSEQSQLWFYGNTWIDNKDIVKVGPKIEPPKEG
jgi:hypothetical protein